MLRNIFTSALFVAMILVLVAGNMQAQALVNASMTANANVMAALSISASTMDFGNIPISKTVVLDPKNAANQYVGSTAAVGTVTITGAHSTDVLVTWPATIPLKQASKPDLTLTLAVNGDASNANQATSSSLSSGADVVTSAGGNYSLWVGGSLPTSTDLGGFTGTATFSVEYK